MTRATVGGVATTLVELRETPLSVPEVLAGLGHPAAGGTTLFVGTVRNEDHGRRVRALTYEAHPGAAEMLREVVDKVVADFPVIAAAAVHRVGDLDIGDIAVIVAAACPHREEAFAAARRLIDDLKSTVPIWKLQTFDDGTQEWVGCP